MLTSRQIRQQFLDFFVQKHAHVYVPSSPVVPQGDATLLFANAGMNQFKPYFLGTQAPPYPRAANTQKCIRAGGKHNDLEDVGKDTYHHTFFEMLGNWSFGQSGGYFKKDAIAWAWDLLTHVYGLDPSRLHATYFRGDPAEGLDPDTEARDLWLQFLPPDRVHTGSKKDNFWEMGDTGPCGPCSEIHYDATPGKTGGNLVNAGDPEVIEIWNLVFIQFNRAAGVNGQPGKLSPLPAKHVDTGMGYERLVRFLQGKTSNYDTDVFTPIFAAIQQVTKARPYGGKMDDAVDTAYRVIADHIRCLTIALTDGAVPSNEGRGYVLRRILRRAVRHGRQNLGVSGGDPFFFRLVPTVVETMGDVFPELKKNPQQVADIIKDEEISFGKALDRGIELHLSDCIWAFVGDFNKQQLAKRTADPNYSPYACEVQGGAKNVTEADKQEELRRTREEGYLSIDVDTRLRIYPVAEPSKTVLTIHPSKITPSLISQWFTVPPQINAKDAFRLHGTYGFDIGLTQVMAEERGMTVDVEGFNRLMDEDKDKARSGGDSADESGVNSRAVYEQLTQIVQQNQLPATEFLGYQTTQWTGKTNCRLFRCSQVGALVTAKTPFYAESGGQVGDVGTITFDRAATVRERSSGGAGATFHVLDTQKIGDAVFHLGRLEGAAPEGDVELTMTVDAARRGKIMANHTMTHVMNRALRAVVSPTADQRGSLVDDQKLRFDFSHNAAVTDQQIEAVQKMVNADIAADLPVHTAIVPQEQALKIHGLRAVFGEKYPPKVRVVATGVSVEDLLQNPGEDRWAGYAIEFCGGTHLARTGQARRFVIVGEEAVGKGLRRLTALTGQAALDAEAQAAALLAKAAKVSGGGSDAPAAVVAELSETLSTATLPLSAKAQLRARLGELQKVVKEGEKARSKEAAGAAVEAARKIAAEATGPIIVAEIPGADADALRAAMDVIKKTKPDAALLLAGSPGPDKVAFVASVPQSLIAKGLKAGDWVKEAAKVAGGGGGGRPDMAQAGGKDPTKLGDALKMARSWAQAKV